MENAQKTIADLLLADNLITQEVYDQIKLESVNTGKPVDTIVEEKKVVSEADLSREKAKLLGIKYIDIRTEAVNPTALSMVPEPVAKRYNVLPINYNKETNILSLAMADPSNLEAIEFVRQKSGAVVVPVACDADELAVVIDEQYQQDIAKEVSAAVKETQPEVKTYEQKDIGQVIKEAPIAKIVSTMLDYAAKSRASDIHIEAQEERTRVRYRIDGILHERLFLPKGVHDALISRIKILSGMKIDEKRVPQDGRFNFKVGDQEIDLRVSTLPTVHGEKIVMRLLRKSAAVPTLPELGLRGVALKNLESSMLRPHGIIIVCGPTGSGKTTTLYAVLSKINTPKVNISTLEDPVEYEIPGVNQVQVNDAVGLTFAEGLKSFLRQDPNIILVGEIRDKETTDLAIQAALTGHLVFSTLHTSNASGVLPRLLDLGAEAFLVASTLTCVVGQRIARKICNTCKTEVAVDAKVIEDIKTVLGPLLPAKVAQTGIKLYHGKGCNECNNTGYLGRIGIFEVLQVSDKIGRLVLERADLNSIEKQAVAEGMITMKQDGYLKALEGITTIEEVIRIAQE